MTSESIGRYAESLKQEIRLIRLAENVDKVDVVAHSMGGLVARWFIERDNGYGYVRKLVMLETPNRGCLFSGVTGLLAQAVATCILAGVDPQVETWMNRISAMIDRIPIINDEVKATWKLIQYAGYVSSILARVIGLSEWQSYIDILTGMPSVDSRILQNVHYANIIGWLGRIRILNVRTIFTLDGVETVDLQNWANGHAALPRSQEVIDKVKFILNDDPGAVLEGEEDDELGIQLVTSISNTISQGETATHGIPINNASLANFVLVWSEGALNLTLVSSNGTLIDPSYVNPSVTYYDDSQLAIQGYAIENPSAGIWNVSVLGTNVSLPEEEYVLSAYLDTNMTLCLELPKNRYEPNEVVTIRANLTCCNQPIAEASLNAVIQKPDSLIENTVLYDDGLHGDNQVNDGLYANTFTNTSLWGKYDVTVVANGSISDGQFARQAFAIVWVKQCPDLSLTESAIHFSKETATEGEIITINATIHNIGETDANNASILFYDGNPANGTLIGECIINVTVNETATASIQWNITRGKHQINAMISPYNEFLELNYTNNIASKTIEATGHDITILAMTASKTVVSQSYEMRIDIAVENQGDFLEDFNVTLCANTTIIGKLTVGSMPNGTWTILIFAWNTSGFVKGNYTITAAAEPVQGETYTADNTLVDGWIFVSIPGDINGDKYVNAKDAIALGVAFYPFGDYNPNADINDDYYCNAKDAVILGTHFDEYWE